MPNVIACPHCLTTALFNHKSFGRGRWEDTEKIFRAWYCQACNGLVLSFHNDRNVIDLDAAQWVYPSVPQAVAASYISGVNCLGIGEALAATVMFSRSIQLLCLDKGANPKDYVYIKPAQREESKQRRKAKKNPDG